MTPNISAIHWKLKLSFFSQLSVYLSTLKLIGQYNLFLKLICDIRFIDMIEDDEKDSDMLHGHFLDIKCDTYE